MKKITKLTTSFALVAVTTLTGCSTDPTGKTLATLGGAGVGALIAKKTGADDLGIALSAILGAAAGQAINTSRSGGCVSTGTTQPIFRGGHIFHNANRGVIQCPIQSVGNNKVVQSLYNDPNWQPVQYTIPQQRYRTGTYGQLNNVGNNGPILRGFN